MPYQAGNLVKGTITLPQSTLYIRMSCRDHVFRVGEPVPSGYSSGSGWAQPATCLVCGDTTLAMDAEWWLEEATLADVAKAAELVRLELARLTGAYKVLIDMLTVTQADDYIAGMVNFDS